MVFGRRMNLPCHFFANDEPELPGLSEDTELLEKQERIKDMSPDELEEFQKQKNLMDQKTIKEQWDWFKRFVSNHNAMKDFGAKAIKKAQEHQKKNWDKRHKGGESIKKGDKVSINLFCSTLTRKINEKKKETKRSYYFPS